jgi:hypothetical protein
MKVFLSSGTWFLPLLLAPLARTAEGHGHLESPRSRNYLSTSSQIGSLSQRPKNDFNTNFDSEYNPNSLNFGGNTYGVCGRSGPTKTDYTHWKTLSGTTMPPSIQATYTEGAVVELKTTISAAHKGHIEFYLCEDVNNPTQECFNRHPLEFVSYPAFGSPKDTNYPNRGYIAPNDLSPVMNFRLPRGISGDHVLLQWKYVAANSCLPKGYTQYPFPSGWSPGNLPLCPDVYQDSGGLPEQFWNCADVRINSSSGGSPTPVPPPSGATCGGGIRGNGVCARGGECCSQWGWCGTSSAHCSGQPTSPSPPPPTPTPPSRGTCGGGSRGNGACASGGECCSQWGWCGTSSAHCSGQPPPSPTPAPPQAGTCGGGNKGNGACANGAECCSQWGWCGTSSAHCGRLRG